VAAQVEQIVTDVIELSDTVVGQPQVVYTYDNANRLTQVQQGTNTVTIGYDDADRRTSVTYPNTNSITYGYNVASELTSLTYKQGTTTLGDLTYTYDAAGNRIKTGGTFARSNLPPALTTTNYNVNNQQLTLGTSTETYDLNGNLATSTDAGVTTTHTWNTRNQLTSISRTGFTASFTYDSFGRRTGRTVNGTVTNYVYDGLNPVQEKNGVTVTANLLTGLGIDEFFTRTDSVGVRSLLSDALSSTVALGDGTGTLQTQYTYEPFGITTQTGAASTSSYKFTGREDDGTGLMYYRARYYHPRLQRFISEDPIGFFSGNTNPYAYVANDPLSNIDPLGLKDLNLPGGFSGRVDSFNLRGESSFEIHICDGLGNEIGIYGPDGWINKHGKGIPIGLPSELENALKGISINKLRARGKFPPKGTADIKGSRWLKYIGKSCSICGAAAAAIGAGEAIANGEGGAGAAGSLLDPLVCPFGCDELN